MKSTRRKLAVRQPLPDVRDGLTRLDRVILWQLAIAQTERNDSHVPTALLYGRVSEHLSISVEDFQRALTRLVSGRSD